MGPKPVSFDNLPAKRQVKEPSPLFAAAVATSAKPPVEKAKPTNIPAPLSFKDVQLPPKAKDSTLPNVITPSGSNDAIVSRTIQQSSPELYSKHHLRIIRQVQQLLPLTVSVVLDWGIKTQERVRDVSNDSAQLIQEFTSLNGATVLSNVMEGINPGKNLFEVLKRKFTNPSSFKPQMLTIVSQLSSSLPICEALIDRSKKAHEDVMIKLITLSAVVDFLGTISDNTLDVCAASRRSVLTQGVMQAELTTRQLEDLRIEIINLRVQIERVLNVTLPAYEMANSRK